MEPEDELFEDDFNILEIIDFGFPRRLIFDRANNFEDHPDLQFFRRYRLMREAVFDILQLINAELQQNDINQSVSPINQLLTALRFYASAGHLIQVGDVMKMDIATVSRIVVRGAEALAQLFPLHIHMPQDENARLQVQRDFFDTDAFPRILGVIGGTHITIQSPGGEDAELFRNRKNYFSLNVQAVGDAQLKIMDLVARWPGSTHDATIFNNSFIRARFERPQGTEFPNSVLLGDSVYPVRHYFFTPLLNPHTDSL